MVPFADHQQLQRHAEIRLRSHKCLRSTNWCPIYQIHVDSCRDAHSSPLVNIPRAFSFPSTKKLGEGETFTFRKYSTGVGESETFTFRKLGEGETFTFLKRPVLVTRCRVQFEKFQYNLVLW